MKLIPLCFGAVAAIATSFAQAQVVDEALKREVAIFERVLMSALQHDTQDQVRSVSGYYLKDQGVVFELALKRRHRLEWISHIDNLDDVAAIGEFELPEFDMDIAEIEISQPIAEAFSQAYSDAAEKVRAGAEKVREAVEQERENRIQLRELERQKAELEFAKRHESDDQVKEFTESLREVEKRIEKLSLKDSELKELKDKLKASLEASRVKRAKEKAEKQQALEKMLVTSLARSLCDYGAGLRSLPRDEHISFIYNELSNPNNKQVFVYPKSLVQQCVKGEKTAKQLAEIVTSYRF
ncbi:hypothetical protein KIJ96_11460 [Pseudoalteromonas piscicida]|uniref:hypothetical protein n=1 Tax=Pseudoalteromonas piscicida TaxID=43662 RepID=UPI001D09FEB7|nr:hypothetical protein [Pseudoalteromonas piscicida]UDM60457.1 hypothetical protein KIJ96_11460 [Pseudoalteromonas piscicida]